MASHDEVPSWCRPLIPVVCEECQERFGLHPQDDFEVLAMIEMMHFEKQGCMGALRFVPPQSSMLTKS